MRKRLQQSQQERANRDNIRVLGGWIELLFWMLRNMNTSAASGTGGSGTPGTSFSVEEVDDLPAIPVEGYKMVYWKTPTQGGSGDGQTWEAYSGQARWYPCQKYTALSGAPGS